LSVEIFERWDECPIKRLEHAAYLGRELQRAEVLALPQPSTLNPQPSTLNPQPSTLNPQPWGHTRVDLPQLHRLTS
ncbi:hypothetical protein T484DRAFT_3647806, partial [Baffinella frigidus]